MRRIIVVLMMTTLVALAAAGTAWAKPIVGTEVTRWTEGPYSDESTVCQTELYSVTFSGRTVEHYTYFPDTGVLHFHDWSHGKVVAVPLDGTGPSYTANFRFGHSDTFSNVERGELVRHTYIDKFVAHGSDGSRAYLKTHEHYTINANGVKTVDFETTRMVCT